MKHRPNQYNVLIACEESQAECKAFRELGFKTFSCDIQECHGGHPEWHIHGDVTHILDGCNTFYTQDNKLHRVRRWHLVIAHPPCTYLCKMGSVHMVQKGVLNQERYAKMLEARKFFFRCLGAPADCVAVENPRPMGRARLPRPQAQIQPWWFGVKYSKATYYWLKNLPPLMPTLINPDYKQFVRASRGKYRSRTFPAVAAALAKQWGDYLLENVSP